jgi:hypothetical protein
LNVNLWIICSCNYSLFLFGRLFFSLFLLDFGSIWIFVFLFVLLKIVSLAYLLDVVELLLVELKADRVVGPHCLSPQHKVFEGGDLEAEDIVGDVGLKVVEESEVFVGLQLSPFLVDCFLELLDDLQLHHEELLIIGVNEPLARSLVVEVEWSLLSFLLPF